MLIPLFLVTLFVLFVPRSPREGVNRAALVGKHEYAVVFDAGSTGSRVHVFKFVRTGTGLVLLSDTFEQLKPGLGDKGWAAEPQRAAASLQPLLDKATAAVPENARVSTPVELRATAGLRLLPGQQAEDILKAVRRLLQASAFSLVDDGVTIMDGADEGAYAWMTLNYLLGKTGQSWENLVGAIDLGGGSVQQAFAVDDATAAKAPKGYIRKTSAEGVTYNVYVHSYLGYGLMQGRGAVLAAPGSNTCISKGTTGVFKSPYGGQEFVLQAAAEGGDMVACAQAVVATIKKDEPCGAEAIECSFAGVWGAAASHTGRTFYVSSYFFDRALDAGIVKNADAKQMVATADQFAKAATRACKTPLPALPAAFPAVGAENAPYLCLDLTFQYVLLTDGLKVAPSARVTLVKQVQYRGEYFEAAWPLGAAINTLSVRGGR